MIKKYRGVVVSETPWKENSKIINILTEDGIIGVVSNGCKNLKSPLRNISIKLTYAEFIVYTNGIKMGTLREGYVIDQFNNIKSDLKLISYYTYITELVSQVMRENPNSTVFNMYISTILKLEKGLDPMILMNILEIKLLDYLGVGIQLNGCCKCGTIKNIITVDPDAGGYICSGCYTNELIYDATVRKMLRMYYLVDIDSLSEFKIKDYVRDSINQFLSIYYERYTGLYIHSKKFLNNNIQF